jgi:SAM-dependent methyltransferase
MRSEPNAYSRQWFEFFHVGIDEARTVQETDFVCHCAPREEFPKIIDVCCGMGRHAHALSKRGYVVTGIDRDAEAITTARELGGGPNYILADIRDCQFAPETFDAAIVLGQSFGHCDPATNRDILLRIASSIRKRGRVILDLWNPEFFLAHQGERELTTSKGIAREIKRVGGDRLFVQLDYPDGAHEKFEWQLFSPEQMERMANSAGLILSTSCNGFDARAVPSPTEPRIQFVLERAGSD